jgi:hypothetical protein
LEHPAVSSIDSHGEYSVFTPTVGKSGAVTVHAKAGFVHVEALPS